MAEDDYKKCMDWISAQQETLESSKHGKNQRAVSDAIDELQARAKVIEGYRTEINKVLGKNTQKDLLNGLEAAYSNLKELYNKKINNLIALLEIASLEDAHGNLANEFDRIATNLGKLEQKKKEKGRKTGGRIPGFVSPAAQESIFAVRDTWKWIQDFNTCTGIHLKNAAQYHQFFQTSGELEENITEDIENLMAFVVKKEFTGDSADGEQLQKEFDNYLRVLRQWEMKIILQWNQASKILPVHLRTEAVLQPRPIYALCDYETKQIHIRDGEELLLLDNTNQNSWKVKNCLGKEAKVPAVVCHVPGPCTEAMEAAVRLWLRLLSLWTETVKMMGNRLITFLQAVFKDDYPDKEKEFLRGINGDEQVELQRVMAYGDDTLLGHWMEDENFKNLRMRFSVLKSILEETGYQPENGKPASVWLAEMTSVTETLVDKYKLLDHEHYLGLVQLLLQETNLLKRQSGSEKVWKDWLRHKSVLDSVEAADFLSVIGNLDDIFTKWKNRSGFNFREKEERERKEREERERKEREERERKERELRERLEEEKRKEEERERLRRQKSLDRRIAKTSMIASSEQEEERTFEIESVYDPRTDKRISLTDAEKEGIIDMKEGIYINPKNGEELYISAAMEQGLIRVCDVKVRSGKEKQSTTGLITIVDANNEEDSVTYLVKSVMDTRNKAHLTFQEAVSKGILNVGKEVAYRNTATEQNMDVGDAINHGFITAEILSDPKSLDVDPENKIVAREQVRKPLVRAKTTGTGVALSNGKSDEF